MEKERNMTQEELQSEVDLYLCSLEGSLKHGFGISKEGALKEIMDVINQHVAEVIGEDERLDFVTKVTERGLFMNERNELRAEQRIRAGLVKPVNDPIGQY